MAKQIRSSRDILSKILQGMALTPADLDAFAAENRREDLHLEFKHGRELEKPDPAQTVQRYVSAFANSDGGILLMGVEDGSAKVTGCKAPGGHPLADWAGRCLSGFAGALAPPPRIHVVDHPNGQVLSIATARGSRLVPVVERRKQVHYFRVHADTLEAPDYLVSDLLLGHRQQPTISPRFATRSQTGNLLSFSMEVEVDGVHWVDGLCAGVLGLSTAPRVRPSSALAKFIEVQPSTLYRVDHQTRVVNSAHSPFGVQLFGFGDFIVPADLSVFTWSAALYVSSKRGPTDWYQIAIGPAGNTLTAVHDARPILEVGGE